MNWDLRIAQKRVTKVFYFIKNAYIIGYAVIQVQMYDMMRAATPLKNTFDYYNLPKRCNNNPLKFLCPNVRNVYA